MEQGSQIPTVIWYLDRDIDQLGRQHLVHPAEQVIQANIFRSGNGQRTCAVVQRIAGVGWIGQEIDLAFRLGLNNWQGTERLQLIIEDASDASSRNQSF